MRNKKEKIETFADIYSYEVVCRKCKFSMWKDEDDANEADICLRCGHDVLMKVLKPKR